MLGPDAPALSRFAGTGGQASVVPVLPAVTCPVQSTYLTGRLPSDHGVVGNGWYFREECEVHLWRQSNRLVQGEKLWDVARRSDPDFKCANLFWWFNMYSSVDLSVTPRPMYLADGRKLPDVYTHPADLRDRLQGRLGTFPLFQFWGPTASITSTEWIAQSARLVEEWHSPTLSLVYLPHLDYDLQRFGASGGEVVARAVREIDAICGELIDFYRERDVDVLVLSEYGITDVSRPVHVNRLLRQQGLLAVRGEMGFEQLDAGASTAFAVADHQVAHVHVREAARVKAVRELLEALPGVERVLDAAGKRELGIDHDRSGELTAIARPDAWFTYYHWLDDERAPDYARTVDIHRKPGYDPVELFLDPGLLLARVRVGATLMKRRLGFRSLLEVVSLDAGLVRGSHGRLPDSPKDGPLVITSRPELVDGASLQATDVFDLILTHLDLPVGSRAHGPLV
jgi:predicted AlkP superfamily pyrophosphatase or phosphodiesterase